MILLLLCTALVFLAATVVLCKFIVEREPDFDEAIAEILEQSESRVHLVIAHTCRDLPREKIHEWMRTVYRDAVLLALGLGGFAAHLCLVLFTVLFVFLWLKTWILPRPKDLRLLLGGQLFILCQLKQGSD